MRYILTYVLFLFCLAGCTSVTSKNVIGVIDQSDYALALSGTWLGPGNEVLFVKHQEKEKLTIAMVESEDQKFVFKQFSAIVSTCSNKHVINIKNPEDRDENHLFALFSLQDKDTLLAWSPKAEHFREALLKKKLKGTVDSSKKDTDIFLTDTSEKLCSFITSNQCSNAFDLEKPFVYKRLQ